MNNNSSDKQQHKKQPTDPATADAIYRTEQKRMATEMEAHRRDPMNEDLAWKLFAYMRRKCTAGVDALVLQMARHNRRKICIATIRPDEESVFNQISTDLVRPVRYHEVYNWIRSHPRLAAGTTYPDLECRLDVGTTGQNFDEPAGLHCICLYLAFKDAPVQRTSQPWLWWFCAFLLAVISFYAICDIIAHPDQLKLPIFALIGVFAAILWDAVRT